MYLLMASLMASDLDECPLFISNSSKCVNKLSGSAIPILTNSSVIRVLPILIMDGKRREMRSNPLRFRFMVQMYLRRMGFFHVTELIPLAFLWLAYSFTAICISSYWNLSVINFSILVTRSNNNFVYLCE